MKRASEDKVSRSKDFNEVVIHTMPKVVEISEEENKEANSSRGFKTINKDTENRSIEDLDTIKNITNSENSQNEPKKQPPQNWLLWIVGALVLLALGILVRAKMRKA